MKIAVVHSFYREEFPSGENLAVNMQVEALRRMGHEVQLLSETTPSGSQSLAYKFKSWFRVATGFGNHPLNKIVKFNPDIIHVHNLFPNFSTSWIKRVKQPIVVSIHNYRPICAAGTLFRDGKTCFDCVDERSSLPSIKHSCYKGSKIATIPLAFSNRKLSTDSVLTKYTSKIFVLTEEAKNIYKRSGWPEGKIQVLPNFVSTPSDLQEKLGADKANGFWLYVGRLSPEKGITNLVKEWPTGKRLVIVGEGPEFNKIEELIASNQEVSLRGRMPNQQVLELMSKAEGLIFPSLWPEGLPLVFLEALSVGCVVVARHGNVVAKILEEHRIGQVFDGLDQLAAALEDTAKRRFDLSQRSIDFFKREYSEAGWAQKVTNAYLEVLS